MLRPRTIFLAFTGAVLVCSLLRAPTQSQSTTRRITNTTEEGISISPSISGDGQIISFESTEDEAGAGGPNYFRAIRANISVDPPTLFQMGRSRAGAPAVSQDGSRIAFASKDDPLGTNADGNSEIFLFNGSSLLQVTNTTPGNPANRVTEGNFQPSISDDGRFVAFSSNRNLTSNNGDGNLEVVVFDSVAATFIQLTNSTGVVGFTDAKISGDGSAIACIHDSGAIASTNRDLLRINRTTAAQTMLASNVARLAMTYGRAISDDGSRVAYTGETAPSSTQIFFYDGRSGNVNRQVTTLGTRTTEVPLHPTISGDGRRIAFATRRAVMGFSNADASVELYTYDIPTGTFGRVTSAPGVADCFDGSNAACEVVSSLNDDGSTVVFNFPRALSGAVTAGLESKSEIYATGLVARPPFGALTSILNQASLGHEPSPVKAVAPNSIAVAFGGSLANTTEQSKKQPGQTFPTNVAGTTVTVNGRAAQIFFVSPDRVHFLVPSQTEIGNAEVLITNADGFASKGTVPILRAAPGIFTKPGDGLGEGMILNADTLAEGPFDPSGGNLRLLIFSTGVRNGITRTVNIGGRVVTPEAVNESTEMPGLDEVLVRVPADLRGAGNVDLLVQTDGRESNPVTAKFRGDPSRNVVINEVLADPPDGIAGDANHDGTRDGTQDEFIELVNGTSSEVISLRGWTIRTRATGSSTETTRFTFASGTSLLAGEAIVVFGGGNFTPADPIFGCAQVVKATTTAGLSLTNSGLTILLRDASGNLIAEFGYGGSTGFEGDTNQSIARSPDIAGAYVQHTTATGANGRRFSPGLKNDGTPFGVCPSILTGVTISPPSATNDVGQTQPFTAQAFDQYDRAMNGVTIAFSSDNTNVAAVESVTMNATNGVATANVKGRNPGVANITASATNGMNTVNSTPAMLTVTGPALSINDLTQSEGNAGTSTFIFTVSLSTPAPAPVTFDIATQDNTATSASGDYVARSLTSQTIAVGQQTYTFDVTVIGDVAMEQTEAFFVNVSNVSGASVTDAQGVGTIVNDDIPGMSVNDVAREEGNTGTTTFTFTVSSNLPAPPEGITFDIATQDSSATVANGDYVARSLTSQSIPAGQFSYTFDVNVNGDTTVETNEAFFVNISNVSANASIADGQGVGTLQNDDLALMVISQIYGGGNNSGATFKNDFVELFNRGTTTVDLAGWSVQQASATGTSWSATELCPVGSCLVAPGKYFLVKLAPANPTIGADLPAPDATGTSNLSATSGKVALVNDSIELTGSGCPFGLSIVDFVGYGSAANCSENSTFAPAHSSTTADFRKSGGCIDTNDNAADFVTAIPNPRNSNSPANDCSTGFRPDITINNVSISEGDSGTKTADFTVALSAANNFQIVTVNYATADGTANSPSDYQSTSGQLMFNPGETSKPVTVTIVGDTMLESNETFQVNLTNPVNAVILDGQGQGTIIEDEVAPTLSINDVSMDEGNSGTKIFQFTVSLSGPALSGGVAFDIATHDNSATVANGDYVANSLTSQTIPAGQQTYTFSVTVSGDGVIEPNETFFVNVTNISGATAGDTQGVGTIQTDDSPVLSINDVSTTEGDTGTKIFTFTISSTVQAPAGGITFDITTQDGTAQDDNPASEDNDYVANSTIGKVIAAGTTSTTFSVTVNGDKLVEPDETFNVMISNASGGMAGIGDNTGVGTIQNDDAALLVMSQLYGGGNNSGATFQNDFVEIFNRGTTTVDFAVTPYSVQYASVGSDFGRSKTNLTTGSIAPGQYFLVRESGGTTNGVPLPSPDATGSIAMASTSGKVALVVGTSFLTAVDCPGDDGSAPFNPVGGTIADLVGYGSTAANVGHCYEGSAPAPAPSSNNMSAASREAGGCTDTNDNAANFFTFAPSPRNSGSPVNNCTGAATPNLSINNVSVTEGDSGTVTATFTVSLSAPAQGTDVTFDIATADNTAQDDVPATEDKDYVAKSLTSQIIPAGQTTYTFTVTVNGDTAIEPDETFFVNISNVSGASVTDGQGLGTIQHDDLPTLSINDVLQAETNSGTTTFTFTASLSAPAPATVSFDIVTADGTAQDDNPASEDNDYQPRSLTAPTIAQGSSSYTFDVTVNGDTADEGIETFFVNVSNVSGATVLDGQGLGTIQNDDAPPTLSIGNVTQAETNAGTTTFTFTVSLSAPALTGGVRFTVNTADGTTNPATAGSDYVAIVNGSGSIAEGNSSTSVDVTVNGDTVFEPDEIFFVNLTGVTGATVSDGQGLGTITNDDTQPSLAIADAIITEGNAGTSLMTFTVTLTGTSQSTVSVNYATADSSAAVANSDYDSASGTLNFVSGDTSETFTVTIHGDMNAEGDEVFLVDLSGASGATIADSQALGIIFLDDPFSIAAVNTAYSEDFNVLAPSGVSATTPAAWTRAESGTAANNTYRADDGGSNTGDTYSYGTGSSTERALGGIQAGALVPTIGAFYRNNTGTTVTTLQISYTGEEWRLGTASRTDQLDFQYSTNATSLTTGTWTDVNALDFTTPNTTTSGAKDGNNAANRTAITNTITGLSIAPGATFWIRWTDFNASSNDDGLAIDDFSITAGVDTPALSINNVTQAETNSGTTSFDFTVSLTSPAPPGGVSFTINTADGSTDPATAGSDYVAIVNGSGSIAQNNTSTTVTVTVNGDMTIEADETFFVNISGVTGATVDDGQGFGTITNDDAVAASADLSLTKTVNNSTPNIGENVIFTITLNNDGPDAATGVQVADLLPAGLSHVSSTPSQGTYTSATGIWNVGTVSVGSPAATLTITATVTTTGAKINMAQVTASSTPDSDSTPNDGIGDDFASATVTGAANLVINEIHTQAQASPPANSNDFIELYNKSSQAIDISGMVISYRAGSTSPNTFTIPASTVIGAGAYLIIVNGAITYGVAADIDASSAGFNLTATSGGVKIVLNGVQLDGLAYQTPGNTVSATFAAFGEGTVFTPPTASGQQDYVRSPNGADSNDNATDFRRSGANSTTVTPKAANPTITP